MISIESPLAHGVWREIVRLGQTSRVHVVGQFINRDLQKIPLGPEQPSLKNVFIRQLGITDDSSQLTDNQHRFLYDSDISIGLDSESVIFWDLVFAFPQRFVCDFPPYWNPEDKPDFDISVVAERRHCAFGKNELGEITQLFLPNGSWITDLKKLTSLKTLSFDDDWLSVDSRRIGRSRSATYENIKDLANLESLYFSWRTSINDLEFAYSMKRLKHLQVRPEAYLWGTSPRAVESNLESLTLFGFQGSTDPTSELKSLPKLKKLTVIDLFDELQIDPNLTRSLKLNFPGVQVEVVARKNYSADIPDSFKDHLQRKQHQLRMKFNREPR